MNLNLNDIFFFNICLSNFDYFINSHNILYNNDFTKNNFINIFDYYYISKHINNSILDKRINNYFFYKNNFSFYYRKGTLIKHLFHNFNNDILNNYEYFVFFTNLKSNNTKLLNDCINNLKNIKIKKINGINYYDSKNDIYIFNILEFKNKILENLLIDENINHLNFLEKIYNIYNIKTYDFIKDYYLNFNKIIDNSYLNNFNNIIDIYSKQSWIIIINNDNNLMNFNINFIYYILYSNIKFYNIFLYLHKSIENKNFIYNKLSSLLYEYSNIFLIYDYPYQDIKLSFNDIIKFTNFNEKIIILNYKNFYSLFTMENSVFQNKNIKILNNILNINGFNNNKIYYENLDYYRLKLITNNTLDYIIFNKNYNNLIKINELKQNIKKMNFDIYNYKDYYFNSQIIIKNNIFKNTQIEVINLEERYDRYCKIKEELEYNNFEFELMSGIKIYNIKDIKYINTFRFKNNLNYMKSICGCKLSHIKILEKYLNKSDKYQYLLIFEDDFIFRKDNVNINNIINLSINELEENNIDFNILYLTSTNNLFDNENINLKYSKKLKNGYGYTTSSYIINIKNINNLLSKLYQSEKEIDVDYSELIDNRYLINTILGYQSNGFSDIQNKYVNYGLN